MEASGFFLFHTCLVGYSRVALVLRDSLDKPMNIRTPKHGRARANFFEIIVKIKLVAIELAATIIFFVWLYRELIHELKR
jgi:hypothetical protein